jgi:enediyne biosynthesis protein E4
MVLVVAAACTADRPVERPPRAASSVAVANRSLQECWTADPPPGAEGIQFSDITATSGLMEPLTGMFGHAAAWGDANQDGWPDLFVGTFADKDVQDYQLRGAAGPSPDRLLMGGTDGFVTAPGYPATFGRSSGAAFADVDGDGRPDLVVARNVRPEPEGARPSEVLRNHGGRFAAQPLGAPDLGGRSVAVLDWNRDGLPDLFVAEDRWSGGSSVLLRNEDGERFEDATAEAGLPPDLHGLGAAAVDLTADGRTDLFVAGSNRLFVALPDGRFEEAPNDVFRWPTFGGEDDVSGVSIADLNRDGRPDIVLGHHYNSTVDFGRQVPARLYLHGGVDPAGNPRFEDITEAAGLVALPTKAPHVEIADFDNDGWPDIVTTASAADGARPAIFRHLGLEGGIPHFEAPVGLGDPHYWVTGPTQDVDRDGRLDVLLVEWEPSRPSLLLRNESNSGNWLSVEVDPEIGGGVGSMVAVYQAGRLGELDGLIGVRETTASQGYAAGTSTAVHFGLGPEASVDVRIRLPEGKVVDRRGVPANRYLRFPGGCPS